MFAIRQGHFCPRGYPSHACKSTLPLLTLLLTRSTFFCVIWAPTNPLPTHTASRGSGPGFREVNPEKRCLGGGGGRFKWSVSQRLLRLQALIRGVCETEPAKKPHVEPLRWTERVVWHLFSTKKGPGIVLNRPGQPEPALQHVVKQQCAGRRARGGRRLHFGRYITFQTKLNGSECENTTCVCRVGGQGACVCLSKPPPRPHPSYLPGHRSNNVCRHRINLPSMKSSQHASISFWLQLMRQTAAWVHAATAPACGKAASLSVVWTRQAHANSECKWDHVCQPADLWIYGWTVVQRRKGSFQCLRSRLYGWNWTASPFWIFMRSHSWADQAFPGWTCNFSSTEFRSSCGSVGLEERINRCTLDTFPACSNLNHGMFFHKSPFMHSWHTVQTKITSLKVIRSLGVEVLRS